MTDAALYEERLTLWRVCSVEEAVVRAEEEAMTYAAAIEEAPATYLGALRRLRLLRVATASWRTSCTACRVRKRAASESTAVVRG